MLNCHRSLSINSRIGKLEIYGQLSPESQKANPAVEKMVDFIETESAKSCDYTRKYEERIDLNDLNARFTTMLES